MSAADLFALLPLEIVAATAVVVMLTSAFCRRHGLVVLLTLAGLAASGVAVCAAWPHAPRAVTALLRIDHLALLYSALILAATTVVVLLSFDYWRVRLPAIDDRQRRREEAGAWQRAPRREEYYVLLLLAAAGAMVLVSSVHLAGLFLGLELLSVSLYALVAYAREDALSIEAGVKYLILSGASSAFVLFGMALIYAAVGALDFGRLAAATIPDASGGLLVLTGVCMLVVGAGFKLSLAPFHGWAPDVYQGAPAPVAGFVATVSKGAVLAVMLRYAMLVRLSDHETLLTALAVIAAASMFVGNLLALWQRNIKRLLAYSSIAHMGYVLVALLASGPDAPKAVTFYLAAYFVTTLGAFGIIGVRSTATRDADELEDYTGLAWRHPWQAGIFTAMLLSLAGIPLTAGFLGKFFVLTAGVKSSLWLLVVALVVNSTIGLFYYLRVIVAMCRPAAVGEGTVAPDASGSRPDAAVPPPLAAVSGATLGLLTAALLWLGIYPAPAMRLIQSMIGD